MLGPFESHRGGIEIVAGQLARQFRELGHSVSWLAADASSPPAGNSVGDRVLPLRACNALERWADIPLPLPGFAAFKAIKREVAWADWCIFMMRFIPLTSSPTFSRAS